MSTPQSPSGFTSNYTDPGTGITLTNAWIQIRQINYTPYSNCLVVTDVYLNESSFPSMKPLFYNVTPNVNYTDPSWNTYFDPSVMTQSGHDIQAQSLAYLQSIY